MESLPEIETKPNYNRAQNICELIQEFHKLPKIYPTKPKKKKPAKTAMMLEQYAQRKKERENAMNHGTRTRIKRAEHHCDSLKGLYISRPNQSTVPIRRSFTTFN